MELGLHGKYALITGGSRGIGRAIALALAGEGCHVAVCARKANWVDDVVDEIKQEGVEGIGLYGDVLIPADIDHIIHNVLEKWNKIHILVNNVGGGGRWGMEQIEATEPTVWTEVYNKNAVAAVRFTSKLIPLMRKQKWGRVVTISSIYGKEAGGRPWFNMSKAAEISLMKTLAKTAYLVRDGITFNSVAPGAIMIADTGWDTQSKENPDHYNRFVDALPLGRLGTPEEVAHLVTFLCSEKASLINGACVTVDGGESYSF